VATGYPGSKLVEAVLLELAPVPPLDPHREFMPLHDEDLLLAGGKTPV
jgi:hypothetical protein